jgi:TRAP-type C4-dicarboxylate transport system substrate-binding protein
MKKSQKCSVGFLILMVVAALITVLPSDSLSQGPAQFQWRAQDAFSPTTLNNYSFLKLFANFVNDRSKGRIKITHYDFGAIVQPFDVFDAVSKGTVEMGTSCGAYYTQKLPEGDIEYGLPFDGLPLYFYHEMAYKYKDGQYMKILRDVYAKRGIHYLVVTPTSGYGFMTNFPIRKIEDLKGRKMRTTGTIMIEMMKQLGAAPVAIPGAEMYMALQRKTVDGITLLYYLLESNKLAEVVKYVTLPDIYNTCSLNLLMNLEAYNKLPDDLKKLVNDTAEEVTYKYLIYSLKGSTEVVLDWAKSQHGLQVTTLPDNEVEKMQNIVRPLYKSILKTPASEQLYSIRESFLKEKKIWK